MDERLIEDAMALIADSIPPEKMMHHVEAMLRRLKKAGFAPGQAAYLFCAAAAEVASYADDGHHEMAGEITRATLDHFLRTFALMRAEPGGSA